TSTTCGISSDSGRRQTWLDQLWTGFSGLLWGNQDEVERQEARVVGGSEIPIAEAPFMVYVESEIINNKFNCSGVIISNQYILTAARCVRIIYTYGYNTTVILNATLVTVWVGSATNKGGTSIVADSWKTNTKFETVTNWEPIALIHLPTPLTFSESIQPICYPTTDDLHAVSGCSKNEYGWGATDWTGNVFSPKLKKLSDITIQTENTCRVTDDMRFFCVTANANNTGACFHGDFGGPFVVRYGGRAFVIGVFSGSVDLYCGSGGPAIYMRASNFADWVKSVVKP
ncbi:unnamed protein product, partial [Darwinula stevensoni]